MEGEVPTAAAEGATFGTEVAFERKLPLDREGSSFASTLTRRFVIAPSFSIYGGDMPTIPS